MQKFKRNPKTSKIKIFKEVISVQNSAEITIKEYIHPLDTFINSYAVMKVASANNEGQSIYETSVTEFTINKNKKKIEVDMFIEFKDKTYKIESVDYLEYLETELKLRGKEVTKRNYNFVTFREWNL